MTNKNRTVLYTGFTNNLKRRVAEHKSKLINGFSKRYNTIHLLYYEEYSNSSALWSALVNEKVVDVVIIESNFYEMFNNVEMIGNNTEKNFNGVASPSLKIKEVQISGK